MGSRRVKKMSGGDLVEEDRKAMGEAARKKVEEQLAAEKKISEKTKAELDAVPLKDRIKKVIKKVTDKASGGKIKGYASGGMPKAKKGRRGDGICSRGRTKGRMV